MPAAQVRLDDVVTAQLDIDLEKDPPAAWPTEAIVIIERTSDLPAEAALSTGVPRQRRRSVSRTPAMISARTPSSSASRSAYVASLRAGSIASA